MAIDIRSNSPVRQPPDDYAPAGSERWFTIPAGLDAGKQMFYFDHRVGGDPPRATVLFVHGNPESSYTYRHVRDGLLASGLPLRLVAADNIGFGLSDQATFEMIDMHHAANLAQLVDALQLTDVTLVIHDWGGPIGTGAFRASMERVTRLVVLNTTIFPMPADGWTYENFPSRLAPWCKTPRFIPKAAWGGMAGALITAEPGTSVPGMFARTAWRSAAFALHRISPGTAEAVFSEALRPRPNVLSSQRNVFQTPVWGHGYQYVDPTHGLQDNAEFYRELQAEVPRHWRGIPAVAHIGEFDPLGKESVLDQWRAAIPGLEVHRYPGIGHFVAEAKGPEIAASMVAMLASGSR